MFYILIFRLQNCKGSLVCVGSSRNTFCLPQNPKQNLKYVFYMTLVFTYSRIISYFIYIYIFRSLALSYMRVYIYTCASASIQHVHTWLQTHRRHQAFGVALSSPLAPDNPFSVLSFPEELTRHSLLKRDRERVSGQERNRGEGEHKRKRDVLSHTEDISKEFCQF